MTGPCFFVVLHLVPTDTSGSFCYWIWPSSWLTAFSYHSSARKVVQCCECKAKCLLPTGYLKEYRMLLYLSYLCILLITMSFCLQIYVTYLLSSFIKHQMETNLPITTSVKSLLFQHVKFYLSCFYYQHIWTRDRPTC